MRYVYNNEELLNKLGDVFNRDDNNVSHVNNRLTKHRQSFYGLGSAGIFINTYII